MALNSIQYDEIMRRYSERRNRNASITENRRLKTEQEIPQIASLREEMVALSIEEAKLRLFGNDIHSDYEMHVKQIEENIRRLLIENGYTADYLDPLYDCPLCKDSGAVNGKRCTCFHKEVAGLLLEETGFQELFEKESFATVREDYYSQNFVDKTTGISSLALFRKALHACKKFTDEFDRTPSNLLLYGDTGIGKTFLCNCVAGALLKQGHTVIYMPSFQLFETLAKNHFHYEEETVVLSDSIMQCDLLVIDDLGTELLNKFVLSELFSCLNERLLRNKPTIISTNLSLDQLKEQYTERIFSRITSSYTLLKLAGDDIRIKKKLRQEKC